jgi:eukaryotic-like serine/threonine-protein kinase
MGQGGFGAVYSALDVQSKRRCAVKENLLDPNLTPDQQQAQQQQFLREATMLSRLQHPCLPQVFAYFAEPGGQQYLVMEFIEGTDLETLVHQRGGLSESQAVAWIVQILAALEYLHTQQPPIIHRDIKPLNIIITPQARAILVDFGIAKQFVAGKSTTAGAIAVSPGYSPLEQYGQGRTDARSDLYALGATLYFALTQVDPCESVQRAAGTPMKPPRELNANVSLRVEQVVLQAMEMMPQNRFQNAQAMRSALVAPAVQIPRPSRRATVKRMITPRRAKTTSPRSRLLPVLGGILAVCGLATAVLLGFVLTYSPASNGVDMAVEAPQVTVTTVARVLPSLTPRPQPPTAVPTRPAPTRTATPSPRPVSPTPRPSPATATPRSGPPPPLTPPINLAPNPSFEEGSTQPAGWDSKLEKGQVTFGWDNEEAHTGNRSLSIKYFVPGACYTAGELCAYGTWTTNQRIPFDPKRMYELSAWYLNRTQTDNVQVFLTYWGQEAYPLGSGPLNPMAPTAQWTLYSQILTPEYFAAYYSRADHVQISFMVSSPNADAGGVWIDDIALKDITP